MNKTKFLVLRLVAYVLVAGGLMFWISRSKREGAFEDYSGYWESVAAKGSIDAAVMAHKLYPLLTERGVAFLTKKALTGKGEEVAVAVMALDTLLDAVRHTPQSDPEAVKRILRPLAKVDMAALNDRAVAATTNQVIRRELEAYIRRAREESAAETNTVGTAQRDPVPSAGQ